MYKLVIAGSISCLSDRCGVNFDSWQFDAFVYNKTEQHMHMYKQTDKQMAIQTDRQADR